MSDEPNTGDVCPSCNGDMSWPDGCDECGGSGLANPAARASLSPLPPIPSADGGGQWTPDPEKPDHYTFGPLSAERTITLTKPHVATLPTGERVELPAGTVLREGTGGLDHRHLLACARGVVDHDAAQALTGPVAHALLSALRVACGDSIEDVAVRAGLPREMAPSATPIIDAWRAAGEPAAMTFTAEEAARLTGIAAIFPEPSCAPPHTVREEDDTGVRFADRSQAMADRNKRALETWNITAHESHLPDPPIGSGCLVYDCWTPCAPGHHHCARHGGADAVPPPSKPRT